MNNKLYLLGGYNENSKPSQEVYVASLNNLSTSHQLKWLSAPNTPWHYSYPAVLYNKYLLTVGGREPSDFSTHS